MSAHLLAAIAQGVSAGQFLSGSDHSVLFHEIGGQITAVLGVTQVLILGILRVPRQDFVPFLVSSILVLLADALQIGTGYGRYLSVHVPLGMLICGGTAAQLVWSLR